MIDAISDQRNAGARPAPDASADTAAGAVLDTVPRVMRLIRSEMRGAAGNGVTVPQLRAMLFVRHHPGSSLSTLADHLGVGLASASTMVDRLVRQGILTRGQDPHERRRVMLELTREGVQQLDIARRRASDALANALASCTPEELAAVTQAMTVLSAAAGRSPRA